MKYLSSLTATVGTGHSATVSEVLLPLRSGNHLPFCFFSSSFETSNSAKDRADAMCLSTPRLVWAEQPVNEVAEQRKLLFLLIRSPMLDVSFMSS